MKNLFEVPAICTRLKVERERLGLTQDRCSGLTGITRTSQSRYETGASAPSLDYLTKVGELGFDVHYVLFGRRSDADLPLDRPELVDEAITLVDELAARHGFKPPADFRIRSILLTYNALCEGGRRRRPSFEDLLTSARS